MVFILLNQKLINSAKTLDTNINVMYDLEMEKPPEEPPPPDPIMINAQEPTTIEDLQGDTKKMTGEGFRYNSGGSLSKSKNENLRKFVSLKIK